MKKINLIYDWPIEEGNIKMSEEYKTHDFRIKGMDCLECASSIV